MMGARYCLSLNNCIVGGYTSHINAAMCKRAGGYDRGECLDSMECYDPVTNKWSALPSMSTARGRFDVTHIGNKLYACGGSDGARDLKSAEVYDWDAHAWSRLPDMAYERSSPGVAAVDGKLYVIGGWSGCAGLKKCEVFDPEQSKWSRIADMTSGWYQTHFVPQFYANIKNITYSSCL